MQSGHSLVIVPGLVLGWAQRTNRVPRRMEMEQGAEKEENQGRLSARASKPGIAPGDLGLRARLA